MRPLKCWIGNYDGRRQALIVATSQKAAAKIAGCGIPTFVNYFLLQDAAPAWPKLNTLYTRPMDTRTPWRDSGSWTEGRR